MALSVFTNKTNAFALVLIDLNHAKTLPIKVQNNKETNNFGNFFIWGSIAIGATNTTNTEVSNYRDAQFAFVSMVFSVCVSILRQSSVTKH